MLPDAFYRLLAFPNGIAMIGLGYSLWRDQRAPPHRPSPVRSGPVRSGPVRPERHAAGAE